MALIIEDGTGKEDATSYVTVQELQDFAALRGVTLPAEEASVEVLLIKASDYLLSPELESSYQGRRVNSTQALSFPRSGLIINCVSFPEEEIPSTIKKAQMQAALELASGTADLSPSTTEYPVYREKIDGAVERQFMTPRQLSTMPDGSAFKASYPKIEAFIYPVLRGNECPSSGDGAWLKAVRI